MVSRNSRGYSPRMAPLLEALYQILPAALSNRFDPPTADRTQWIEIAETETIVNFESEY